ncbi:MAG: hypothetical protein WKF37_05060 [Bryobacteraceae bacterium]
MSCRNHGNDRLARGTFYFTVGTAANAAPSDAASIKLRKTKRGPVDAAIDLLIEERGNVNMPRSTKVRKTYGQSYAPMSIIISDGFYVRGRPHPRLHGTFLVGLGGKTPRLAKSCPSVHKITLQPAQRFQIAGRGFQVRRLRRHHDL